MAVSTRLKLKSLKLQFGRLHSLCSVLLPTFRLGRLDLSVCFRVREIDSVDIDGLDLHLEDAEEEHSKEFGFGKVLKQGLLKQPQKGRLAQPSAV